MPLTEGQSSHDIKLYNSDNLQDHYTLLISSIPIYFAVVVLKGLCWSWKVLIWTKGWNAKKCPLLSIGVPLSWYPFSLSFYLSPWKGKLKYALTARESSPPWEICHRTHAGNIWRPWRCGKLYSVLRCSALNICHPHHRRQCSSNHRHWGIQ